MGDTAHRDDDADDGHYPDADYYEPRPPKPARTMQVQPAVLIGGLVVILAIFGWFGWQAYSDKRDSDALNQLTSEVKTSMQQELDRNPDFSSYGIKVHGVTLFRESETKYSGMARVTTTRSAVERSVPIEVTTDGSNLMWQAPPGAFLFLAQEALAG